MLRQTIRMTAASKVSSPSTVTMNRIRMVNNWLGARVNVRIPLFWQLKENRDTARPLLKHRRKGQAGATGARNWEPERLLGGHIVALATHEEYRGYPRGSNRSLRRTQQRPSADNSRYFFFDPVYPFLFKNTNRCLPLLPRPTLLRYGSSL